MYDLYGMSSPNVTKVVMMLEELGAEWTFKRIDVLKGEQFAPVFLALNPNGRVPVLVDRTDSASPFSVIESGAILLYLAEQHGRFVPDGSRSKSEVVQWLMFQMGGIGPMFGQYVHFNRFAPADNTYAKTRYEAEARRLIAVANSRLRLTPFLGGPDYSIADMAAYPWLSQFSSSLVSLDSMPSLAAWLDTVGAREAVRRATSTVQSISELDRGSMSTATSYDLDRLFNRAPANAARS